MAESIGTMSAKITTDLRGLSQGVASAKSQLNDLSKTKVAPISLGGLIPSGGLGGIKTGLMQGLGIGGGLGVAEMVAGGIASIKNFAIEMGKAAWAIRDDAGDFGLSVEMFQDLQESAKRAGESMDVVTVAITKMDKAIADAFMGEEAAVKMLRELKLSAQELIGLNTDERLKRIAAALVAIENPLLRARLEMELFGKSGRKADDIIKDINDGLDKYSGYRMSAQAIDGLATATDNLGKAWRSAKAYAGEFFGRVLGTLATGAAKEQADNAERERQAREASVRAAAEVRKNEEEITRQKEKRKAVQSQMDSLWESLSASMQESLGVDRWAQARAKLVKEMEAAQGIDEAALALIDKKIAKTKELESIAKMVRDTEEQRKSLASEMGGIFEKTLTVSEKMAAAELKVAQAEALGAITRQQAMRIRDQNRRDILGESFKVQFPEARIRGTMEEFTRRQDYIAQAMGLRDQQNDAQERAAKAGEQGVGKLVEIKSMLDKLVEAVKIAPVWAGQ